MKSFTDNAGRSWTIQLTIDSAKRVRDLMRVDLLQPEAGDPPLLTRLGTDEILLCDVIYCLIKPQADKQEVTDEQFGTALGGDVILAAQKAFYGELIDFFQKRGRVDRAKAVMAQVEMINLAISRIEQTIGKIDLQAQIDSTFGNQSTKSQEALASILQD